MWGLLEAAARFDPHREVRFSTYATWWIRASIQDYILRNWSIVRGGTSSGQKSLFFNLRRLRAKITAEDNNINTQDLYSELANAIGVSVKDVATMDARLSGVGCFTECIRFLQMKKAVASGKISSRVKKHYLMLKLSEMIDGERRSEWLHSALDVLNERELRIVNRRRLSEKGATLEELGNELGISKERVRQLENRALKKLQTELVNQNPEIVDLVHSCVSVRFSLP